MQAVKLFEALAEPVAHVAACNERDSQSGCHWHCQCFRSWSFTCITDCPTSQNPLQSNRSFQTRHYNVMFDQSDLQTRPVLFPITHISGSTSSSLDKLTVAPKLDTPAIHCAKTKPLENQTLQAAKHFEALAEPSVSGVGHPLASPIVQHLRIHCRVIEASILGTTTSCSTRVIFKLVQHSSRSLTFQAQRSAN